MCEARLVRSGLSRKRCKDFKASPLDYALILQSTDTHNQQGNKMIIIDLVSLYDRFMERRRSVRRKKKIRKVLKIAAVTTTLVIVLRSM